MLLKKTRTDLELNDALLRQAQVHALSVLHVEGTLVELGHGVVGVEQRHLLVHLPDDEARQGHAGDGAHQLHRAPVVNVPVSHRELLRLALVVIHSNERSH